MKRKQHRPMPKVNMITIGIDSVNYLLITVRKDAIDFIVDNAMQYLIYKVPAYENWVTDDILEDWGKLEKYLEKHENSEQYRTSGCKLPDGNWKCLGLADKNGFDNYVKKIDLNPKMTLVLQPLPLPPNH